MVQINGGRSCQHGSTVVRIGIGAGAHSPRVVVVDVHPWHLALLCILSCRLVDLEDGVIRSRYLDGLARGACMVVVNGCHILVVQVILHHCGIRALRQLSTFLDSTLVENARHRELLGVMHVGGLVELLLGHDELFDG